MEKLIQQKINNFEQNVESEKKKFCQTNKFVLLSIITLIVVSFILILPFCLSVSQFEHDMGYHAGTIRALNDAWKNGNFGDRIYGIICQDYGYGNGLFYSMIPVGTIVIFMNVFNMSASWASGLMFFFIVSLSGITVFYFIKKVFKSNLSALVCSLVYTLFPYFITDIYVRFSISEIFLMLAIPLISLGLYDLIENNNYKSFMLFFTIGTSLAILTHLSATIYIGIVALVYILLNWKKFIKEYNFVPFLISCALILLIAAILYVPILMNFGLTQTDKMNYGGFSLWKSSAGILRESYLVYATISTFVIFVPYLVLYLTKDKFQKTKQEKTMFIMCVVSVCLVTPVFPWFIMWGPFSMLQFAWRLFCIVALANCLMLGWMINNVKGKYWIYAILAVLAVVTIAGLESSIRYSTNNYQSASLSQMVEYDSYLYYSDGQGAFAADYHPINADNNYIYSRANEKMILSSTTKVEQLANFKTLNLLSFTLNCENEESVVLRLPYSVCQDLTIEQKQLVYPFEVDVIEVEKEEIEGTEFLKLNLNQLNDSKVLIKYNKNSAFDEYLTQNPFEFIVQEGSANFTKYVKTNSCNYSVEVVVSGQAVVELPTLYYKGYSVKLSNENGTTELKPVLNEHGFVQVTIAESGTLTVKFEPKYVKIANILSIIGLVLLALTMLLVLVVPRQKFTNLGNKTTEFFNTHKNAGEILRFIIVGGIATLVDMFTMGVVMYLMQKSIYTGFLNVFIGAPTPSTLATIVGTSVGFLVGLVVNYILSIAFVFNEKGNSKSAKGFVVFTALSVVGLGINILGTYIGFDLLKLNQWLVKIIMILVVLVYNYISKKLVLFKNKKPKDENIKPRDDKTKQK